MTQQQNVNNVGKARLIANFDKCHNHFFGTHLTTHRSPSFWILV